MSNPRVYYAMAEDKILPPIFKKVNTKTQVQEFGLTFFISVMIASVFLLGSFENIVNYVLFIDSISLASAAAAIFILRRKSEKDYSDFKMKLYPIVPLLFIVKSKVMILTAIILMIKPGSAASGNNTGVIYSAPIIATPALLPALIIT